MAISFNNIPSNIRVPLFYGEIDNSQANVVGQAQWNALLVGQMLDDGTATENIPLAVSQASQANATFGRGSQIARMVTAFRNNCPNGQLYCIPTKVTEGVKAQGRVTFKGTSTEGGYINLYIASDRVRVSVPQKTEAVQIAQDTIDAINALPDLPVTAQKATSGQEATSGKLIGGAFTDFDAFSSIKDGNAVFYIDGEVVPVSDLDFSAKTTQPTHATLTGTAVSDITTSLISISDGSIVFTIDGQEVELTGLDFSGVEDEQAVCDKINAKLTTAVISYETDHFVVTANSSGASSTIAACTDADSGTAIAAILKLDEASSPSAINGMNGITITITEILEVLNEALSGKATVNYADNALIVTSATIGSNSRVDYCSTGVTGTDIASMLKFTQADGGRTITGVDAEDLSAAVDIICKGLGEYGNDIILQTDLRGATGGEKPVNGVSVTIVPMQNGVGLPNVDELIAHMGDTAFDFIGVPWTDSDTLDKFSLELSDISGRWSYARALFGHVITAKRGLAPDDLNSLVDFGQTRNDQHASVLGLEQDFASAVFDVVGALTGLAATNITNDPARPLQSLTLEGIIGAPLGGAFDLSERNTLLLNGIACQNTQSDRTVTLNRLITTYRVNSYGDMDTSYLDSERLWTLSYIQRYVKTQLTSKYPRHKLADDGTRIAPGQAVVTPSTLKAEVIGIFYSLENLGIVESVDSWKDGIIVERNATDTERIDMLIPCDLMNGLRVIAENTQFRA